MWKSNLSLDKTLWCKDSNFTKLDAPCHYHIRFKHTKCCQSESTEGATTYTSQELLKLKIWNWLCLHLATLVHISKVLCVSRNKMVTNGQYVLKFCRLIHNGMLIQPNFKYISHSMSGQQATNFFPLFLWHDLIYIHNSISL